MAAKEVSISCDWEGRITIIDIFNSSRDRTFAASLPAQTLIRLLTSKLEGRFPGPGDEPAKLNVRLG